MWKGTQQLERVENLVMLLLTFYQYQKASVLVWLKWLYQKSSQILIRTCSFHWCHSPQSRAVPKAAVHQDSWQWCHPLHRGAIPGPGATTGKQQQLGFDAVLNLWNKAQAKVRLSPCTTGSAQSRGIHLTRAEIIFAGLKMRKPGLNLS